MAKCFRAATAAAEGAGGGDCEHTAGCSYHEAPHTAQCLRARLFRSGNTAADAWGRSGSRSDSELIGLSKRIVYRRLRLGNYAYLLLVKSRVLFEWSSAWR